MNYASLIANIQDICENSFTADELAMFTQQAEQKIYSSVQIANLRRNVTGTLTISNQYLSVPGDFLSVYSLAVIKTDGTYEYLLNKDVNFIRQAYPQPTDTDIPKYYAIFGPDSSLPTNLTIILGPTPDLAYSAELHYFYYPESIVTASTSWIGDNFESALLYGALREAVIFQKGEQDMVAYYEKMYMESLGLLKNLGDGKLRRDAYRSGQIRLPVK